MAMCVGYTHGRTVSRSVGIRDHICMRRHQSSCRTYNERERHCKHLHSHQSLPVSSWSLAYLQQSTTIKIEARARTTIKKSSRVAPRVCCIRIAIWDGSKYHQVIRCLSSSNNNNDNIHPVFISQKTPGRIVLSYLHFLKFEEAQKNV